MQMQAVGAGGQEGEVPTDPRSATEQNPEGAEPEASTMAEGEGDEFAAMRARVEAETAEQGENIPQE